MSDEFTPTTEQVRDGYAIDPVAEYHDPLTNHTLWNQRAFDRWLAEYTREKQEAAFWEGADARWDAYVHGTDLINPYGRTDHAQ
jgi:hypothetical protein